MRPHARRALLLVLLALGLSLAGPSAAAPSHTPTAVSLSNQVDHAVLPGRVDPPRTHAAPHHVVLAAAALPVPAPHRSSTTPVVCCAPYTAVSGTSSRGPPGT